MSTAKHNTEVSLADRLLAAAERLDHYQKVGPGEMPGEQLPELAALLREAASRLDASPAAGEAPVTGTIAPPSPTVDGPVTVWADGSCLGNPGPGGWAAVLPDREIYGGEPDTTNNRMDITAAIKALEAYPPGAQIEIRTDSQLVVKTMNDGWKTKANVDLWTILKRLTADRRVTWTWVKGHAHDAKNNRCDLLARGAAMAQRR